MTGYKCPNLQINIVIRVIFHGLILRFAARVLNLPYKFEAIHNKDYSVVKTLRAAATCGRSSFDAAVLQV